MHTNFERAKATLDALMVRAERFITGSVDDRVAKRCRELRLAYDGKLLDSSREPVDYSKPTTQIAYLYRTFPAHADWTYRAFQTIPHTMHSLAERGRLKVACIGGGPGSDLIGLVKFLEATGHEKVELDFIVLDREAGWNVPRAELCKTVGLRLSQSHQYLDLTEDGDWTPDWAFADADIFTFSFALSEVWCYNASGTVTRFLDEAVRRAKSGALFVYVDNGGEFSALADEHLGRRKQLKLLSSRDDPTMRIGLEERRSILEDAYMARFKNERVKMGGNVAIRAWQKK